MDGNNAYICTEHFQTSYMVHSFSEPWIDGAEPMLLAIRQAGLLPFFRNRIPGYSVQDLTRPGYWFDGDEDPLGPWDWKIDCVQSGDIAYGKFLCGGKASFATVEWYKELRNWRLATTEPDAAGKEILAYLAEHGTITSKEVRLLLGVRKSAADAAMGRLQYQCRIVTGDITRVYRGPELKYVGWQVASYCEPEALFRADDAFAGFPGFPFASESDPLATSLSPEESYEKLLAHIMAVAPGSVSRAEAAKILK